MLYIFESDHIPNPYLSLISFNMALKKENQLWIDYIKKSMQKTCNTLCCAVQKCMLLSLEQIAC